MRSRDSDRPQRKRMPLGWRFTLACLLYHFVMAVMMRSAEAPDEWWQGPEIAYYLVFHKGSPTWEWRQGIRSVFFPSIFAVGFKLLHVLGLDSPRALYLSDRVTQAAILAGIHVTMCHLAQRLEDSLDDEVGSPEPSRTKEGRSPSWFQKVQSFLLPNSLVAAVARIGCVQWYFIYAGVRTYSNVTEALFFLLALVPVSLPWFLVWAGLACMTRVTAAISLIPIFVDHWRRLVRQRGAVAGTVYTLTVSLLMAGAVGVCTVAVDYLFYGRIVVTPYEFLKSNIGDDVSRLFGEHPVYWYFLLALPLMGGLSYLLAFAAPLVLRRIRAGPRTRHDVNLYLACLVWTLVVHSFVAHKEMRFVYSQLTLSMLLRAFVAVCAVRYPSKVFGKRKLESLFRLLHTGSVLLNIVLLLLAGLCIRTGPLDVMAVVRNGPYTYPSLDVVTHCYFMPGYSQVHGKVDRLGLVDCPVVLDSHGVREPTDDALFRQDPERFFLWKYARKELPPRQGDGHDAASVKTWYTTAQHLLPRESGPAALPDALVLFQDLAEQVQSSFLEPHEYVLVRRVRHVTFVEDEGSYVDLWHRVTSLP